MSRIISLDFETFYDAKEGYDIKALGAASYIRDPRFNPYLVSVYDGSASWAGHVRDFNWDALQGETLLSHNAGFDSRVAAEMAKRGTAPRLDVKAWHCTANLTTYLCMRRDLARASEFLLGHAVDKSYRLDADGLQWEQMVSQGVSDKVKEAGRVDAVRCHNFWTKFGHLWPERERKLSDLTIRQCRRGSQINVALLEGYILVAQKMLIQAENELPWMKHGKKPTSPKAIAEECRAVGIPCPPVKSRDGEEAYEQWAATYGPKHRWVKAYTDYRVINKFLETLLTIQGRLDPEKCFQYELLYFGAHTGRWSGAGGFNMQNMRKEPLYCDDEGRLITAPAMLAEVARSKTLPAFVAHVLDIRALFVPRPGKKMILSDLSQIEPRVLAWLVNDVAVLQKMAAGLSPYQAHAEATMGWTEGDMKKLIKEGRGDVAEIYALAKARVLGLGFGCGWRKFITVAYTMAGLDITKDDPDFEEVYVDGELCRDEKGQPKLVSGYGKKSKETVTAYRDSNSPVTGLWKTLDDAFRNSVGQDFEIKLPSGRSLRYPEVKRERKMVADPDEPRKLMPKWVTTAMAFDQKRNGVIRKSFYGGLLTENLVQATARDVFGEQLITLDETSGIDVLWSTHDEAVNEVDQGVTVRDVEHIMSKAPAWMPGLPVACEAQEVKHYLK